MEKSERWFSARLVYESEVAAADAEDVLFEESIRVCLAPTEEAAARRFEVIGRSDEHGYTNDAGELVRWRLVAVEDVQDLSVHELADGVEVHSRLHRHDTRTACCPAPPGVSDVPAPRE